MHRTARCTASLFTAVALVAVPSSADPYPAYVTAGAPISEYTLFANTGWHANWYVGYNTCWIKRFPREALPDLAAFRAAAIGVKLGRAKQKPTPTGRETVREGAVYVGIASTTAWKGPTPPPFSPGQRNASCRAWPRRSSIASAATMR